MDRRWHPKFSGEIVNVFMPVRADRCDNDSPVIVTSSSPSAPVNDPRLFTPRRASADATRSRSE